MQTDTEVTRITAAYFRAHNLLTMAEAYDFLITLDGQPKADIIEAIHNRLREENPPWGYRYNVWLTLASQVSDWEE